MERDSVRVDKMTEHGHTVRCVSIVKDSPSHPWWTCADMGAINFPERLRDAFGDMVFDVAIVDYAWLPVSLVWLTENGYLKNNGRMLESMSTLGVPLWIVDNGATRQIVRGQRITWEEARKRLPLLQAEDELGYLVGKDIESNRASHNGWILISSTSP